MTSESLTKMNTLILLLATSLLVGCVDKDTTEDAGTGLRVKRDCVVQIPRSEIRDNYTMIKESQYVNIPTTLNEGNRIIRIYNETTCDGKLDTDIMGKSNVYFDSSSDPLFAVRLAKGVNIINFVVESCEDIDFKNNLCIGKRDSDSGTFEILAN